MSKSEAKLIAVLLATTTLIVAGIFPVLAETASIILKEAVGLRLR